MWSCGSHLSSQNGLSLRDDLSNFGCLVFYYFPYLLDISTACLDLYLYYYIWCDSVYAIFFTIDAVRQDFTQVINHFILTKKNSLLREGRANYAMNLIIYFLSLFLSLYFFFLFCIFSPCLSHKILLSPSSRLRFANNFFHFIKKRPKSKNPLNAHKIKQITKHSSLNAEPPFLAYSFNP